MPPGLRDYVNHLRDPRTELSILVASALLVLVLAEPVLMSILEALAPAGYAWLQELGSRRPGGDGSSDCRPPCSW